MTANYQPYPEYEESGVEWVGESPAGWEVQPFFVHASQCKRSNKGMVNDNLLSLSFGRVIRKNIETSEGLLPASFETYQVVEPDDVVFRLTDLQNDKRSLRSAICRERGIITSAYLAAQPIDITPSYLAYLMRSYDLTKVFYALGSGLRQSLKYADMKRLSLLVPSRAEQTQISKFLDYETAKIDALIEKQQQLIALLKEKRQAVISHAVTKGLNPDAPMRDSGVEWLGEVPAHWGVLATSRVSDLTTGGRDTQDANPDGEYPFFVRSQTIERIDSYSFEGEGVLTSGDGAGVGKIYHHHVGRLEFHQRVYLFHNFRRITGRYFFYFLREHLAIVALAGNAKSTVDSLRRPMLRAFPVCLPPLEEQEAITEFLDGTVARIDALILRQDGFRELLQERRTALISAAVTGKIDVRGWKAPEPQAHSEVL